MSANVSPECQALLQTSPTFSSAVAKLGSTDPPEHTRLRSVVSKTFSARRIASLAPRIRQIGEELIDQFTPGGPVDLMEQFAFRFPPSVIFDLLGIPRHDMDQIKRWCDSLAEFAGSIVPPEREMACINDVLALDQYVADLFEQYRRHPQDNLTSDFLAVVDSGEVRITEPELVSLVSFSLILGGIETTASAIGNAVQRLLTQRQQWQTLCAQPELIPQAVEETLRLYSSFLGTLRITTEDVEMRGVTIPKGAAVFLAYASANHDETYFADPETFNLHRDNLGEMLTFGRGPHYCLGAPLGRLEVQIALELLTAQFPSLRLVAGQSLSYIPSALLRGLTHLLVEWDASQTM
jgi:cytochrome P450